MRRNLIVLFTLGALVLSTLPAAAQNYNLPPGKWWENDRIVDHLKLTGEQQARIKDLVYDHATRMIDLNAGLEKAKLAMENQVEQQKFDAAEVRKTFLKFSDARRLLEAERFEMLLSVRGVLTYEQWEKVLSLRERIENNRQRPGGLRPGQRSPGGAPRQPGGQGR